MTKTFSTFLEPKLVSLLDEKHFTDTIFENNVEFTVWNDFNISMRPKLKISCENKPRNLYVYGIIWKECGIDE